jgi:hypothetical protein
MPYVQRRTFYGKVGAAGQLVPLVKEAIQMADSAGYPMNCRILSDHQSGRTDRVVWEWEVSDPAELAELDKALEASPDTQAKFGAWFAKLTGLVEYAEVDMWEVH